MKPNDIPSKELLNAAFKEIEEMQYPEQPCFVWLPDYDAYLEYCKLLRIEPEPREQIRQHKTISWGNIP